jgi:3'-phosphoadenosine 5'-phosphosulfate sulfotransferase (PAPS reductase)/FAD synthetase
MQPVISHVVSVSSGKDSTATLLLALKQFPDTTQAVFADTGNEHEVVYEYLDYLDNELGIKTVHLKQDFSEWWWHRRDYIRDKWPEKGVPDSAVQRALALFEQGPTGNPYLDLCVIKGRFPSRMAQFCTQFLKTQPLTEFCLDVGSLIGGDVWSWQGVRRDESARRANALGHECIGPGLYAHRPIAGWTAQQTVDFVRSFGIKLNPLYEQGMNRVGCMPCINASKDEIAEISRRFPEHIERVAEWERIAGEGSKRQEASFFPNPDRDAHLNKRGIHNIVRWAKTFRGGKVNDPRWDEEAPSCSSSYGLCE